jgi:hypothetical protein
LSESFILPRLEAALARCGHTHDFRRDVVPMLMSGRAQWWQQGEGVVVTELQDFPNFKLINYWLVAGRLGDCLQLQDEIDRWARMQGCARAVATGRLGWVRVLPKYGWKPYGIAFAKDLRS